MRLPAPVKPQPVRSEQIILFRISGQLFAVSSASVQEVRSVDTLAGSAREIPPSDILFALVILAYMAVAAGVSPAFGHRALPSGSGGATSFHLYFSGGLHS